MLASSWSDRVAGRALVLDRARAAREAMYTARLSIAAGSPAAAEDQHKACAALTYYATAGSELATTDRLAARVSQGWLETAGTFLYYGSPELAAAELVAYRYLTALSSESCPRSAPRRIRRTYQSGLRRWHAVHAHAIRELVPRAQAAELDRRG